MVFTHQKVDGITYPQKASTAALFPAPIRMKLSDFDKPRRALVNAFESINLRIPPTLTHDEPLRWSATANIH